MNTDTDDKKCKASANPVNPADNTKGTADENSENLVWEELSTEHIVEDEWIDFRRSAYRFPDGRVFEPFYSYSRKDYVVIVASDEEGRYLCVRQFRQGIKEVTTEFPAGGIERADGREYGSGRGSSVQGSLGQTGSVQGSSGQGSSVQGGSVQGGSVQGSSARAGSGQSSPAAENALDAARRELLEETGYVSEEWRHLLTVPSNATIADNYAYIFEAKNCRRQGEQSLDETECLNVRKYCASQIEDMIYRGEFQQAVHVMAWLLARRDCLK